MRIHLIAVGGSVMHNLAITLKQKGYEVTGSDDEIFEPSRTNLKQHGLLPEKERWDAQRITKNLDAVILGMHAKKDNPELLKAKEMGLKIYSYPEYIFEQSKEKVRVVIAGSHGKTTITSMVLHVLNHLNRNVDYLVGAKLEGLEHQVKLTKDASVIVLEGDEYLSSPIDLQPKFLWYRPHLALISGIAWDHINVFPEYDQYTAQFKNFVKSIKDGGTLVYFEPDPEVKHIVEGDKNKKINKIPYATPPHKIVDNTTYLISEEGKEIPLAVFGDHNLQNINGAKKILNQLNVSDAQFYEAITDFRGASGRLEVIRKTKNSLVLKDFAHSPSKLKATCTAVKAQYPSRKFIAVIELHTFSSLNASFLKEYKNTMNAADKAIVYYNPKTIEHKRLPEITPDQVKEAFKRSDLMVRTNSEDLKNYLLGLELEDTNLLIMTSGNFDGIDIQAVFQNKEQNGR